MTGVMPRLARPDLSEQPPFPPCIDQLHPELFDAIYTTGAFATRDMINFTGLEALGPDDQIRRAYLQEVGKGKPTTEVVERFVNSNFSWPVKKNGNAIQYQGGDLDEHGHAVLMSHLGIAVDGPTTIGSPNPVLESGGRYSDERPGHALWFYWDTEPGVAGLDAVGELSIATGLTDNIRDQIMRFRRDPLNGNAPEYDRGQPNIYCRLVRRDAQLYGKEAYENHLPAMLIEYWSMMDGADDPKKLGLAPGSRYRSVARMPDGSVLNVFSAQGFTLADGTPRPRPESKRADEHTRRRFEVDLNREMHTDELTNLYEELHTGAGAGTDFADWMLEDLTNMHTIRVTRRVAPFQNALMFELECTIAEAYRALGYENEAEQYEGFAMVRASAMNKYLFHQGVGYYLAYDLDTGPVYDPTLQDGTFLLESGVPDMRQAAQIHGYLRRNFLAGGGLRTSLRGNSMQSWSGNSVWPNLQRSGARGAWLTGDVALERDIRNSALRSSHASLRKTGYGKERYHAVRIGEPGIGGEYRAPEHNFSWDTGVELDLRHRGYRNDAERRSWLRRRQIAASLGNLAVPMFG